MRLQRRIGHDCIRALASPYCVREISEYSVGCVVQALRGKAATGYRKGPVGIAIMALARPGHPTACVLLALDELGWFDHKPPDHPLHDAQDAFLSKVCAILREGTMEQAREMLPKLHLQLAEDPSGMTVPGDVLRRARLVAAHREQAPAPPRQAELFGG